MPVGDYLVGLACIIGIWGGAGYTATVVRRRLLSALSGAPAALAWATAFLVALIAAHLLPGALGLLSPVAVLVASGLLALGMSRLRPVVAAAAPAPGPRVHDGALSLAIAAVGVAAAAGYTLAAAAQLATSAPDHIDAVSFGLPAIAEWARSGSIWDPGAFLPLFQVRTYPNNGDVVYLSLILPWDNDAFLRLAALPLIAMMGTAVYAIGRELRAPASVAALVAAVVVSTRIVQVPAIEQIKPDVFMYAAFATALLFLLRHARTGARADLLVGGAALGLAFGSRWYGVSSAVVVIAVWGGGLLLARRPPRRVLRECAILAGAVLATGGFWLIRNAILTGNPLYPVEFEPFGVTILGAPRDILTETLGYSIFDRIGQDGVWRDFIFPDYRATFGRPGAVILAGMAGALALAAWSARKGRSAVPGRPLALVVACGGLALAYANTPASAQGLADAPIEGLVGGNARWLVPAYLAGAGAAAWGIAALPPRLLLVARVVLLVAVASGIAQSWDISLPRGVLYAALFVAVAASFELLRRSWPWTPVRRPVLIAGAAVAAALLGIAGNTFQERYNDRRYLSRGTVVDFVLEQGGPGARVGVAGQWDVGFAPTYALFGPRLGNDVDYVGAVRDGQLKEFDASGPFGAALSRGRYDLLVVGRSPFDLANITEIPDGPLPPLDQPEEVRWALERGFREIARDDQFVLLASEGFEPRP